MLELEIINAKKREDLCYTIVEWFSKNYLENYEIEIIVEHKNLKKDEVYGYCNISPYEEDGENPRSFLIELEKTLKTDDYIKTLLHELYHAYQFCQGWLKIKNAKRYWNTIIIDDLDYVNQPHEIEAEQQEPILYDHFVTFLDGA
jgi:predicted metallopeptidase